MLFHRERRPEWAAFFPEREWASFASLLKSSIRKADPAALIDLQEGYFKTGEVVAGLTNLSQTCAQLSKREWQSIINEHFARLRSGQASETLPIETIREHLKVRIYPESGYAEIRGPRWPVAEGLFACLTVDLPTSIRTLKEEEIGSLGMPIDAAFQMGLEHVAAEDKVEREEIQTKHGPIGVLEGDSLYASTHVLMLESQIKDIGPFGALVSIPTRHVILVHAIRDHRAMLVAPEMVAMTDMLFRQGPGPTSPELFWWTEGRLIVVPSKIEGGQVQLAAVGEFAERVVEKLDT